VFLGTDVEGGGVRVDRFPALFDGYFFLLLFGFWSFAFHVVVVVSAQEWHEKLQSLKQDSPAGSPKLAGLR
jgi:hypothetical protein